MTSGDKYGIGYDSSILTYNPSTNTLRIGNSSTADTSHGLIKFGGKNDDCYIGTDALNATLSLSGSDSITFYEGSSGYECAYKSGALYPLNEGTLGTSTYS
jgi:hypothetical protein